MESADGNLHIVFNGEIYDYKELRAELETFGISFCTHSDTEVLVNTLQQYGETVSYTHLDVYKRQDNNGVGLYRSSGWNYDI